MIILKMTARERLFAAVRCGEVDYLPCSIYFNQNLKVEGYDCTTQEGRIKLSLDLGVDPVVNISFDYSMHPDVKVNNWVEEIKGEKYPILWQSWDTSEGQLTQAVKMSPEWEDARRIYWSDLSASNIHKPLIVTAQDAKRVRYICQGTNDDEYKLSLQVQEDLFGLAERYKIPTICTYGQGLATLMFMMGAQNAVYFAMDEPRAFAELAQIVHEADLRRIELARRAGIDILKRFGGYEMTNFYNVEIFEDVVMPKLKQEVKYAHEMELLIYYRVVTGMEPLLDKIASIGFDCIEGGEPHLSNCSLEMWYDAFREKASSWTGISTPILLGGNNPDAVRKEVRHAVDVFGRRGFILGATNSIRNHFPWDNTLALVDEWKSIR